MNQTCDNAYFRFDHYYKCEEGKAFGDGVWEDNCQQRYQGTEIVGGCCAYTPKVQVLDNWGWCNGKCVKEYNADGTPNLSNPPSLGCYNEMMKDESNPLIIIDQQCDKSDNGRNPWTYFVGKVLIPPTE